MRAFAVLFVVCGVAAPAGAQHDEAKAPPLEVTTHPNFLDGAKDLPKKHIDADAVDLDAPDVTPGAKPDPKPVDPMPLAPPATPKPAEVAAETMRRATDFEIRPTSREAFFEKLAPHFLAVKKGEAARARKFLPDIEQAKLEIGMPGFAGGFQSRALGLALAREAEAALAEARTDDVDDLADSAHRAAPDDVATLATLAHVRFSGGDPLGALLSVGEIGAAVVHDPTALASVAARSAAGAFAVVLLFLLVLVAVVVVPALGLLAFDVSLALPRGSHVAHGWALVLLTAAAPIAANVGVVFSLLWIITLGVLYISPRLRTITMGVAILASTLPLVVTVFSRAAVVPASAAARLHLALFDVDGNEELAALRRAERERPLTLFENAALAANARREGRLVEALERWRSLAIKHPELGWVHGAFGTALANVGRDDLAVVELGLAVDRMERGGRVSAVVAAFNNSLIHLKAGRSDKAQEALASAAASSAADLVSDLRRATFRAPDEVVGHNRAYVDVLPLRSSVVALAFEPSDDASALEAALARPLWNGLTGASAAGAIALFPLSWLLLVLASRRLPMAQACERCGDPASRRVDGPDVPDGTCSACFHVFLSSKSRVDANVKLHKERVIFVRSRRRARLVTLFSMMPGAGHLFAGVAVRGALLCALFAICAAGVVTGLDWVPAPRPSSPWTSILVVAPFGVVGLIVLLIGLRSAADVADDLRSGGRS